MDKFLKYFDDKQFVKWVLTPDKSLNDYWNNFLKQNLTEKKQVELARKLILLLRSKKEQDSEKEVLDLFTEIVQKLDERKKRLSIRQFGFSVLKYAAVGLLCFSLGITYYYFHKPNQFKEITEQLAVVPDQGNSHLILADGENVSITEKESIIEYQKNGQIVINNSDTIHPYSNPQKSVLNQLIVPFGKNSSIKLPDGSIAYLNAGSRLVYPSIFNGGKREVYLIGEGFFEVVHNETKPFMVKTNDLEIEVLGTKFNISAYLSDDIIETVLVEGKVKLKETGFHFSNNDYILTPNQRAAFNRINSETKISNVDVMNYVTWHEGFLNFEMTDLNRIVKKLERYYNIQIRLNDPITGMKRISGKLKLKEETERVLSVLANTASVELIKLNDKMYEIR